MDNNDFESRLNAAKKNIEDNSTINENLKKAKAEAMDKIEETIDKAEAEIKDIEEQHSKKSIKETIKGVVVPMRTSDKVIYGVGTFFAPGIFNLAWHFGKKAMDHALKDLKESKE